MQSHDDESRGRTMRSRPRFAIVMVVVFLLIPTVFSLSAVDAAQATPEPDVQSAVDLAIQLSTPLHGNGVRPDPRSFVNRDGVTRDDQAIASDDYLEAREDAIAAASAELNPYLPEQRTLVYAHCSQFLSTVILNTIDPMYPGDLTQHQYTYMRNPNNGWMQVGTSENYAPDEYHPGDIFLTRGAGHTFMWVGPYGGHPDVVAEASFAPPGAEQQRLPSLKRYSIDRNSGLDAQGRGYDVWRFVGRDGDAMPPSAEDSWDYRNIFSDFEATAINVPDPDLEPFQLGPGTSSILVSFTMRTPRDAVPGDEFTLEGSEPFPFRAFEDFAIRASDGTEIATAKFVSSHAVKIVLAEGATTRENIEGTVRLTMGASADSTQILTRQVLTFFGGERELGPNILYDISRWSAPDTSLVGIAQLYEGKPGLLTYVVYRFDDAVEFDPSEVKMTVRAETTGIAFACGNSASFRYEWLSSSDAAPIGAGEAVNDDCTDRDNDVTVRLPENAKPPAGATGVRLRAAWIADAAAESYRFTATLHAPGLDDDGTRSWTQVFRSAALDGTADGRPVSVGLSSTPQQRQLSAVIGPQTELVIDGGALVFLGLIGAAVLFRLGYWAGRGRRSSVETESND